MYVSMTPSGQAEKGQAESKLDAKMAQFRDKAAGDFSDIPDDWTLPEGDVKRGAKLFKKHCWQCHSVYSDNRPEGNQLTIGPTMFNVYGRASGIAPTDNGTYRVEGVVWCDQELMNYMKAPRAFAEGPIQMNFSGISAIQPRVDIIHYLKTLNWQNNHVAYPAAQPAGGLGRYWEVATGAWDPKEHDPVTKRKLRESSFQ